MLSGFTEEASGLRGSRSCEPTHATPPTRSTVMAGIDQTRISSRSEYVNSGMWRARVLDARNHQGTPRVATIVGMTIASMMPSELKRICRSATAIGPFGSRTPPVQPPRVAAPSKTTASMRYRISSPHCADDDGSPREDDCGRLAAAVGQKRREQHEQVDDREAEQEVSRPPVERAGPAQSQREPDEERSTRDGGHAVDGAGQPEPPWQQRNRNQEDAVDKDVPGRRGSSGNDRQHGDAGTGIVVGAIECEGPEMRRRPQEDDQEQDQRLEPDLAGRRRPTDHRRQRAGGAADDDVLRRAPFQPHRVHDDVEKDREGEQGRRRDIDRDSKDGDRADGQDKPERARLGARDPAARNRAPDRAG